MTYFAGLDVSLEETSICVVDETGRIVKEPHRERAGSARRAFETICRWSDRAGGLLADGVAACELKRVAAICIETRQANAAMKTMPNKTDRNDAGSRADHADGLVPAGACQKPAMPVLAFASGRAPDGPQRDAVDRKRGAGGPAGGRH